jgi:alkylation response protein AidB-like acyl-CoA dehydrogenase
MTDGSASVLRDLLTKDEIKDPKTKTRVKEAFENLRCRDPSKSWTSGQWMTEKRGGSDVSGATETIAMQYKGNKFKLYGYKWFSSAAEGNMSLALARIVDVNTAELKPEEIRKIPVSLFLLKTRKRDGSLNGIQIIKMKDKLGKGI